MMLLAVCGPFDWNIEGSSPHAIFRSPGNAFSVLQCPLKTRNQQKGSAQSSPQQHTRAKQFILDAGDDTAHTLVFFSECYLRHPQFCGPSPLPQLFIVFHTSSWLQAAALHQASQLPGDHSDHGDHRPRHFCSGACWVGLAMSGLPEATSNGP